MTLKLTLAASLVALGLLTSAAYAVGGVATGGVNIRDEPSTDGDIIGTLSKGEEVDILKCGGGWCLTEEGYVSAAYLAVVDDDEDDDEDEDDEDDDEDDEDDYDDDYHPKVKVKFNFGHWY